MFAKLKKKIAEEAATASRPGGAARIPRSVSKESITSMGADSGDDFASDGSSSREDLPSQLLRRNDQIRKLEAKLSEYAEQVRNLQKTKEKLEIALEKHQDSSMKKLQEQNEVYQANRAKMAEGMALALEKKDQEWKEKLADLEKEKAILTAQLREMREQSLNLFQKRDEIDELEGFQQQELAKVKHMLLTKEENLTKAGHELEQRTKELSRTKEELQIQTQRLSDLEDTLGQLQKHNLYLTNESDELLAVKLGAEEKISELEQRGQDLQNVIQQLSSDLQKAQGAASLFEKTLGSLQAEHESLSLQYEQHKQKVIVEAEEKDKHIVHLQEKVAILEKRIEGNFSEDDHVQALFEEKTALELKLAEARQQLLEARTSHSETVSLLETQISKLNSKVAEMQTLLQHKESSLQSFKEQSANQISELEQTLQVTNGKLKEADEVINQKDTLVKKLQADAELESSRLQQQVATVRHQSTERSNRLEAQIAALETAREFDKTAAQHKISQLEQENNDLKERRDEAEISLKNNESELERTKAELKSREMISVEIAKALEETRKQREELQQQVTNLTGIVNEKDQAIVQQTEEIVRTKEEVKQLKGEYEAALLQLKRLQVEFDTARRATAEQEEAAEKRLDALKLEVLRQQELLEASQRTVMDLEEEVKALHEQLYTQVDGGKEQNGEVAAADVTQFQKENRELEQQIAEKNKTIKQLQQRMTELKKTLQKELRLKPEAELAEVKERTNSEMPNALTASTVVTNSSDLNDLREINFDYLKHVVLKFMSARESEAFQLIKAISVLLNFTTEEENMLKETLEYKMSWFGSKPAPRGIIRPSISGPRTPWQ